MKKFWNWVTILILSLCVWIFAFADYSLVYPNMYLTSVNDGPAVQISANIQRLQVLFGSFNIYKEIAFGLIVYGIWWVKKHGLKHYAYVTGISGLLSMLYMFGESYYYTNSAAYISSDAFITAVSLIRLLGLFFIVDILFNGLINGLERGSIAESNKGIPFIVIVLVLALLWLPQLIAIFPGGYQNDIQDQLKQFFGYDTWSDAHPPFVTMMVGSCVWIGNKLGNATIGLFIYTCVQFLFLLFCISYAIYFVSKKINNKAFTWIMIFFAGTSCQFFYYASTVSKDAPYSAALLVAAVSLWDVIDKLKSEAAFKQTVLATIRYSVFGLISTLFRHNGIYVLIPTSILLIIVVLTFKVTKKRKLITSSLNLVGIMLFFLISKVIYPAMGIEKNSDYLIYINQLQHTTRYAMEYYDEISDEDWQVISKVIDVDKMFEDYNPLTSDGIKPIVNLEASDEDVGAYTKVWAKEMLKHPGVLLDATFNMSYGFMVPIAENTENDYTAYYYESSYPEFDFKVPYVFSGIRLIYGNIANLWVKIPGIRLLQNPGIYMWLYLLLLVYMLFNKGWKYLPCMVPGAVTIAFYLAVPSYYHHPRYSFPLVYGMIVYFALIMVLAREKKSAKEA